MNTAPEPERNSQSLVFRPTSYVEVLDFGQVFSHRQPVEVELGAGDGSFLLRYAARHQNRNFLAVERLLGRLRKIDRKARRAGLGNVRVIRLDASYLFKYLIPSRSVEALHVYFPDPWPKRKHWRNRLVNAAFAEAAARVIVPGGVVYLRTDDADYYTQMREVFAHAHDFQEVDTPAKLAEIETDFERDFVSAGIPTRRAAYQLLK